MPGAALPCGGDAAVARVSPDLAVAITIRHNRAAKAQGVLE